MKVLAPAGLRKASSPAQELIKTCWSPRRVLMSQHPKQSRFQEVPPSNVTATLRQDGAEILSFTRAPLSRRHSEPLPEDAAAQRDLRHQLGQGPQTALARVTPAPTSAFPVLQELRWKVTNGDGEIQAAALRELTAVSCPSRQQDLLWSGNCRLRSRGTHLLVAATAASPVVGEELISEGWDCGRSSCDLVPS